MTEYSPLRTPGSKLAAALVKFQADVPTIPKTRTGQIQNRQYKYADLGDILPAIQQMMATHRLAWTSRPGDNLGSVVLFYALVHESGEREEGFVPLGLREGWTPQEFGSALTYARRYAMSAQLGLATEEDDDGQGASESSKTTKAPAHGRAKAEPAKPPVKPLSAKQKALVNAQANKQGLTAEDFANAVKEVMGVEQVKWDSAEAAQRYLARTIDRFPAAKVDDLLREIQLRPGPVQRGQMQLDPDTGEVK